MKPPFKNPLNSFAPVFLVLMAMFLFGFGCNTSKPTPDPLAGWQKFYGKLDQSIVTDYQDYIQNLSPKERNNIAYINSFEDGAGQRAIRITIEMNDKNWRNILIYDKDDKRIKTIKYVSGNSAS